MNAAPLSREAQLLIHTAGGMDEDRARQLLAADLDWPKLAIMAQMEGATAVLWQWLRRAGGGGVPSAVASQWEKRAMVAAFQMLHLERLLHEVLEDLSKQGIAAMLLKGSALAYTAYGSFAERPMGDLDLLVPAERAEEAWALLQERGWVWPSEQWPREHYARHQHLPPLASARGGDAVLEIHAQILPGGHPFHWPVESVWAAAQRLTVGGHQVVVPHPLHQLLHVCLHFAWSHAMQWGSWRMLRDVAALTRRGDVAWKDFLELAREARASTCCFWTLRLARHLVGAAIPDEVLEELRPPRPEFVLRRLEQHYLRQLFSTESACPSERLSNLLWKVGVAPGWSGHGQARPWQVSERWTAALEQPPVTTSLPRRVLDRFRHAASAVRYLGGITARPDRPPRRASVSPTIPAVL